VTLDDTVDSLYARFLFPEGVKGVVEAVQLIEAGQAPRLVQSEQGATYDAMLNKLELQELPLRSKRLTARQLHDFIRGLDKVPGAWATIDGESYRLYGSRLVIDKQFCALRDQLADDDQQLQQGFGRRVSVLGEYSASFITPQGLALFGVDGQAVLVDRIRSMGTSGRMLLAAQLGSPDAPEPLVYTEDELRVREQVRSVFADVLRLDSADQIDDTSNLFENGAGSMDVTRLAEELKELLNCEVTNDDIYMEPEFGELFQRLTRKLRLDDGDSTSFVPYDATELKVRGRTLRLITQPFINGRFVDVAERKREYSTIVNPTDESVICRVQKSGKFEVELAVNSAYNAFHQGTSQKVK
jgi:formyltetrahydrofolate dehydrogenase